MSCRTPTFPALARVLSAACAQTPPIPYRLVLSLAGPSGTVVGSKFIFDETRNRFVYPADKELRIYFEWQAAPGLHTLSGIGKDPKGRVAQISSDIKVEITNNELNAYWIYAIDPSAISGAWTLEVRINGHPAGSHAFELVVPEQPKAAPSVPPRSPTLDDIYRSVIPSLVWVHRLDGIGRKVDTASGFVVGPDQVATAFQAIDGAGGIEIEFNGGRKVHTNEVWAIDRLADWAVVKADTKTLAPLPTGDPNAVAIGERLIPVQRGRRAGADAGRGGLHRP